MLRFARSHFAHLRGADSHISDFASPRRPRRQAVAMRGGKGKYFLEISHWTCAQRASDDLVHHPMSDRPGVMQD
jgi:hypothetical protein